MNTEIENQIDSFIDAYCAERGRERLWRRPLARCADASEGAFHQLRQLVVPDHFLPGDFLEQPTTVVSYFLPFLSALAKENIPEKMAAPSWADAYLVTNAMAEDINRHLVEWVQGLGYRAARPQNIGYRTDILMSRWSQRHVAWLAGHGSFGINNMLIGEEGCCGRYFSIVTDLPAKHDKPSSAELCLYKAKGVCKVCVQHCWSGALTEGGFDRHKCYGVCGQNDAIYPGAHVCGKCVVGLPCSFKRP